MILKNKTIFDFFLLILIISSFGCTNNRISVEELNEARNKKKIGDIHYTKSRYKEAIKSYSMAIKLNPAYDKAYNKRGNAYEELGIFDQAIMDYTKAIEINPSFAEAYDNRARRYGFLDRFKLSLADYDKSIKINANIASSYFGRGLIFEHMNVQRILTLKLVRLHLILEGGDV